MFLLKSFFISANKNINHYNNITKYSAIISSNFTTQKFISIYTNKFNKEENTIDGGAAAGSDEQHDGNAVVEGKINNKSNKFDKNIDIDRTKIIPLETSIRYLKSDAYKQTYGEHLVWQQYRRNHKYSRAPRRTRKTCVRQGRISTGNPCPICRDEYLVLDYRNLDLLNQFISPHSGEILSYSVTGLCQRKHLQLLVAIRRAMDYGLITFNVPFRHFDYSSYYDADALKLLKESNKVHQ